MATGRDSAYLDTTILSNLLLKPGSKFQAEAQACKARFEKTLLPVYAIKEFKAGILSAYALFHDKLAATKSFHRTTTALVALPYQRVYLRNSALEALNAAAYYTRREKGPASDEAIADRLRLATFSLVMKGWMRRRRVADETIQDLDCYPESEPRLTKKGLFDLKPKDCDRDAECCLAAGFKNDLGSTQKLRDAIPSGSGRVEDIRRREALRKLLKHPRQRFTREDCRHLGDAIFAFYCPDDCRVLTTNLKDHCPLAEALGKFAVSPAEVATALGDVSQDEGAC